MMLTTPILTAAEKLRLRLQAARSTSIPESAYELWARSEKQVRRG